MRVSLESEIPIYKTAHYVYIRISEAPKEYQDALTRYIKGQFQPLIQGEGKGVPAILDAVFLSDYERFIRESKLPLTKQVRDAILELSITNNIGS